MEVVVEHRLVDTRPGCHAVDLGAVEAARGAPARRRPTRAGAGVDGGGPPRRARGRDARARGPRRLSHSRRARARGGGEAVSTTRTRAATPRPGARQAAAVDARARLVASAAQEFAARGFDGAKVDRIAARARVNKAMLYYHFHDKAALHREIIGDLFRAIADAVSAPPAGDPVTQLRWFVRTVAERSGERPYFPAIWLREMADGGRHLDPVTVGDLGRVVGALGLILAAGQRAGVFRPANPLVTQMGIVAPILMFSASAPIRDRFARLLPPTAVSLTRAAVVDHVEQATLALLVSPESFT